MSRLSNVKGPKAKKKKGKQGEKGEKGEKVKRYDIKGIKGKNEEWTLSVKDDSMIGRRGGKGRERRKVRQDIHLSYHRSASVPFDMLALLPGS